MRVTGRNGKSLVLIFAMVVTLIMTSIPVFAATADPTVGPAEPGHNGKAAMKYYGIQYCDFEVPSNAPASIINEYLVEAERDALPNSKQMVYVRSGSHAMNETIEIPANVVLVSENGVTFSGNPGRRMVELSGSLYGGTFDGKGKVDFICWLRYLNFSNKNGEIRSATLQNMVIDGVHYGSSNNSKKIGGAKVIGNTIKNSKKNGITSMNGARFAEISNNTITKVGSGKAGSGINICISNAGIIANNKISNTKGHGISTDTDYKRMNQSKMTVTNIYGNTITNAGVHGIWVDKKVTIKKVNNNTIKKSKKCNIAIEKNGRINSLNYNTIKSPKLTSIHLNGKKSRLIIGNGNKITNSRCGINIQRGAYVKVKGKKNVFKKNGAGIYVCKGGKLKFSKSKRKKNKIKAIRHE